MIVSGRPLDSFDKDSVGILEASEAFASRYGLLVAKALVSPKMGTVPLRLMNVLDQPCLLRKSTVAAIYEPVDEEMWRPLAPLKSNLLRQLSPMIKGRLQQLLPLTRRHLRKPPYLIVLLSQSPVKELAPLKLQNLCQLPPLV